jgi:hypothetical protein
MTYNPEPEIQHYLERLSKAARDLPRGRRRELVAEIEQHVRDALSETPIDSQAEMLTVLDRIGDPEEIATAAIDRPKVTRSTTMETWAIILLLLGGFLWFIGWIAGVVLLWSSSLWTRRDKLIGTLVIPGGLATATVFFLWAGTAAGQTCFARGPISVIGKNGSTHVMQAASQSCHGGLSGFGTAVILIVIALLLFGQISSSIYLGKRLNKEKHARAAATSA